jgi:predicted dehydrogenase
MIHSKINVGVIGASVGRWAASSHIPALQALDEYNLYAVATSRGETARAAAQAFNADVAYGDYRDLIADPQVDLVVIAVKLPMHEDMIRAALTAGKHVYCEWPLVKDIKIAKEFAGLAREKKVHAVIGLQGHYSPHILKVKQLLTEGAIGRVLAVNFFAAGIHFNGTIDQENTFMLNASNEADMIGIHVAHFMDTVLTAVGELKELQAVGKTTQPNVAVIQTGKTVGSDIFDQVAIIGELGNGAVASFHIHGGSTSGPAVEWRIFGTTGELRITASQTLIHWDTLTVEIAPIKGEFSRLSINTNISPKVNTLLGTPAYNISRLYNQLAQDIRDNTWNCLSFDHAVDRQEMVLKIRTAIESKKK